MGAPAPLPAARRLPSLRRKDGRGISEHSDEPLERGMVEDQTDRSIAVRPIREELFRFPPRPEDHRQPQT
jgi:hypothetical protein